MNANRIVVIGASAGGVEALKALVRLLPGELACPVLVAVHMSRGKSVLPQILTRAGHLPAFHPEDGEHLDAGKIYIAPPDWHLLVKPHHVSLSHGPRENGNRPSVDTLFRSAARAYGPRVVGVVLSGALDDGTAGLSIIKRRGGVAVVQALDEALFTGMPQSAIENVPVDFVLPIAGIAALLTRLAQEHVDLPNPPVEEELEYEVEIAEGAMSSLEDDRRPGTLTGFICPECGGALWEVNEGEILRFRCHVGHAYSAETFLATQTESVESALWIALRVLEDNSALTIRMAERARDHGRMIAAVRFDEQAQTINQQIRVIRNVLVAEAVPKSGDDVERFNATGATGAAK